MTASHSVTTKIETGNGERKPSETSVVKEYQANGVAIRKGSPIKGDRKRCVSLTRNESSQVQDSDKRFEQSSLFEKKQDASNKKGFTDTSRSATNGLVMGVYLN